MEEIAHLKEKKVIAQCHLAGHFVGEANVEKYSGDIGKAFASCPSTCIEGCHHGVMEKLEAGSIRDINSSVQTLCDGIAKNDRLKRQCLHGIGHAVMKHNPDNLKNAVTVCLGMPDFQSKSNCIGGTMMENTFFYLPLEKEKFLEKMPTICDGIQNEPDWVVQDCYYAIGDSFDFYTGGNIQEGETYCDLIKNKDGSASCLNGLYAGVFADEAELSDVASEPEQKRVIQPGSPEHLAVTFYNWHITCLKNENETCDYKKNPYTTEELSEQLGRKEKNIRNRFITCSDREVRVVTPVASATSPDTAKVTILTIPTARKIFLKLLKINTNWRISDISCST